jgi:hypothetical protein
MRTASSQARAEEAEVLQQRELPEFWTSITEFEKAIGAE